MSGSGDERPKSRDNGANPCASLASSSTCGLSYSCPPISPISRGPDSASCTVLVFPTSPDTSLTMRWSVRPFSAPTLVKALWKRKVGLVADSSCVLVSQKSCCSISLTPLAPLTLHRLHHSRLQSRPCQTFLPIRRLPLLLLLCLNGPRGPS